MLPYYHLSYYFIQLHKKKKTTIPKSWLRPFLCSLFKLHHYSASPICIKCTLTEWRVGGYQGPLLLPESLHAILKSHTGAALCCPRLVQYKKAKPLNDRSVQQYCGTSAYRGLMRCGNLQKKLVSKHWVFVTLLFPWPGINFHAELSALV